MKNKKGFTLVELLAVIVILLVIVLIAVNVINDKIKKAEKNSVEVNANNYIKAVNGVASLSQNVGEDMEKGTYQVRDLNKKDIKISGEKPRKGFLTLDNYEVATGCLMYDKYSALIIGGKTQEVAKQNCNEFVLDSEFVYSGNEEVFTVSMSGVYKLEVWGAQGGTVNYNGAISTGGFGGYSTGYVYLKRGTKIYINVGGAGVTNSLNSGTTVAGGYNGGGSNDPSQYGVGASGGGATSVALKSGLLSSLTSDKDKIIIVAGGGGAGGIETGNNRRSYGGNAGGFKGSTGSMVSCPDSSGVGGNQYSGNALGQGKNGESWYGSGGAGYYGGSWGCGCGGGSGYIGYPSLYNKSMYCYNCTENVGINTKTNSNQCVNPDPKENCSKQGNGYAKITYVGDANQNPYSHLTVYYDHGLRVQNINIEQNFDGARATFYDDHINLGSSSYQVVYTDKVDLSKYNSVIYKRTNFNPQSRTNFKEDSYRVNDCTGCKGFAITWTSLGNDYYVGDVSDKTDNDVQFKTDAYRGTGSGDIYFIGFSTRTVEQIVADHSFLE